MSAKAQENDADDTYIGLPTVVNRQTGTRHVSNGEFSQPICGAQPHTLDYEKPSPMLGEFPEDFGICRQDCEACASMAVEEHVTKIKFEY